MAWFALGFGSRRSSLEAVDSDAAQSPHPSCALGQYAMLTQRYPSMVSHFASVRGTQRAIASNLFPTARLQAVMQTSAVRHATMPLELSTSNY
jgi:hypothetical protein